MKTTDLFVELVVIGVGVAAWLTFIILGIFGWEWIKLNNTIVLITAVPALSVVYVLGIIFDRVSDEIFHKCWGDRLRAKVFKTQKEYFDARRIILTRSERLSDLLEYGRSRLRICRGWAVNCILILLSVVFFVWKQLPGGADRIIISISSVVLLALMSFGAWFAWRKLTLNEYRKVKEQAGFLKSPKKR